MDPGLSVAGTISAWDESWLHIKVALVLGLTIVHFWLAGRVRGFASDTNTTKSRTYRIMNEVPAVALVAIILLVIFKPIWW